MYVYTYWYVTRTPPMHMRIEGCVLYSHSQLAIIYMTLYTPAPRKQKRKYHHACAVVYPRCITVIIVVSDPGFHTTLWFLIY